jgi:hypothetical protein
MLTPTDEELSRIRDMALQAGILTQRVEMKDLVDRSFIPASLYPSPVALTSGPDHE